MWQNKCVFKRGVRAGLVLLGVGTLWSGCGPAESNPAAQLPREPAVLVPPDGVEHPDPVVRDPEGPLCPDCVAVGGETGDFTGGDVPPVDACSPYRLIAADRNIVSESEVSAQAAIAFVEGERHVPAAWGLTGDPNNPRETLREVSGFSPQTAIALSVEVTGVKRLEWLPDEVERPAGTQAACDGVVLVANVSVSTDDGAIMGTFEGVSVHVFSETEAYLRATTDISRFTGALQLEPGAGEGLGAELQLAFDGDRVRGLLGPYVQLPPSDIPNSYLEYRPLELRWPGNDACNDYSFPHPNDGAERVAPVVATFAASSPYTAAYFEPRSVLEAPLVLGETELVLEVSEPSGVCQGREPGYYPRSPGQHFEFQLAGQLRTADGRYDLSLPLSVGARTLADGTIRYTDARHYSRALTVEEFQVRFDIDGLDFGEAECAELVFEYTPFSDSYLARLLMIQAGPCTPLGPNGELLERRNVEVLGR